MNAEEIMKVSDRRFFLCANPPICILCKSEQVQLIDYIKCKAKWKCRICKHKFEHEPKETKRF